MDVLIVDDNEDAAQVLADAAKMAGAVTVDSVTSGEDAIGKAILLDYDLITLDIRMPGASGLEILSMLRNMSPHAVIALVSGYFTDPMPAATVTCADVLIGKPVVLDKLNSLMDGAERIVETMEGIRELGDVNVEVA